MPTPAASNHSAGPEELIARLESSHCPREAKLKALRDLKNRIIGNRTKKLAFLKLGAVPAVVGILSSAAAIVGRGGDGENLEFHESVLIQSAATLGSFACGLDAGVKAVLDAGAFALLLSLISHSSEKISDASARTLRMIYHSKLAPKFDFLLEKNIGFLLSLLNTENENLTCLGASIISHSCQTPSEQQVLNEAGVINRLVGLLGGSLTQKDGSLEALAAIIKNNQEIAKRLTETGNGGELNTVIELIKDKNPRTRLLACTCIVSLRNSYVPCFHESGHRNKLVLVLSELMDDPSQVGDEAPFVLSDLISQKEDMQKIAYEANAIEKLCEQLSKGSLTPKRLEGVLLALADLCSKLECSRDKVLNSKVLTSLIQALAHERAAVRQASANLLRNIARSVKNLSAGHFMNEDVVLPLVRLLLDSSTSVKIAALGAISNIVVDFNTQKRLFIKCGGVKQLVHLSQSMDSNVRINALWALKNFSFHVDNRCKEEILLELSTSSMASLIGDPDPSVQVQALALIRNLVDGTLNSIEYVFGEDCLLLHAIGRQLRHSSSAEVLTQAMYTMSNIASGNEHHKEAIMTQLFPHESKDMENILIKHLRSVNSQLLTAAAWTIINLTFPGSPGTSGRVAELRSKNVVAELKNMVDDPCLDARLRIRTALGQLMMFIDA